MVEMSVAGWIHQHAMEEVIVAPVAIDIHLLAVAGMTEVVGFGQNAFFQFICNW